MRSIVPRLHDLVGSSASRTIAQLQHLGVEPAHRQVRVAVTVGPSARPAQRLLAATLIDMVLRLHPLGAEGIGESPGEDAMIAALAMRIPITVTEATPIADYSIGIGTPGRSTDLVADAAGWVAAIGSLASAEDDGSPIGALA